MAKAVRIRIRSGNEEHTSLDSLLRNFNIKDVLELLDGRIDEDGKYIESRLERWLKQIHENDKAMRIHNFNQSEDMLSTCLELIQIFFPEFSSTTDIHQVAEKWVVDSTLSNNGKNLYCFLAQHGDSQAALYLFNNNILPDNVHLFDLLSEEQGEKDPTGDIEFVLGICYFEGKEVSKDIEKGKLLINKAANKGNQNAISFNHKNEYCKAEQFNRIEDELSSHSIQFNDYIKHIYKYSIFSKEDYFKWTANFNIWSYKNYNLIKTKTDSSNSLLKFIILCKDIVENQRTKNINTTFSSYVNEPMYMNISQFIIDENPDDNEHIYKSRLILYYAPSAYLNYIYHPETKIGQTIKDKFYILSNSKFELMTFFDEICFIITHYFDLK